MIDILKDTEELTPEAAKLVRRILRDEVKALMGYAESIGRRLEKKGVVSSVMIDAVPGQQGVLITVNIMVQRVSRELAERAKKMSERVKDITFREAEEEGVDVGSD